MLNKGFSLIELIVVVILISILAVSVAPKFEGTAGYEAHSHRAQLIAALRLTQQRAMQQTDTDEDNFCHQIVFDVVETASVYGIPNRLDCAIKTFPTPINEWDPDETGHVVSADYQITFNISGSTNPTVGFDWMGKPTEDCAGGCEINIVHSTAQTLKIYIESEGYINVFDEIHP